MNTLTHLLLPILLGGIAAVIVFATLKGNALPLISTPRAGLIALLVVGLTMCILGGVGQIGTNGRWDSPLAIVGIVLGTAILVIITAALAGWKLPLLSGETQAIATVGILLAVKLILGTAGFFFHWL